MTSSQQHLVTPIPVGTGVLPGTLRARLEELRARGAQLNLKQAVGICVPLCVEAAELHKRGESLFLQPSSLVEDDNGFFTISLELARTRDVFDVTTIRERTERRLLLRSWLRGAAVVRSRVRIQHALGNARSTTVAVEIEERGADRIRASSHPWTLEKGFPTCASGGP